MARSLTAGHASKAATRLGTEPIVILKISWDGDKYYSDKDLTIGSITAEGRIVDLGSISLQKQQDSIGTSAVGSVTLDDKDGALKTIIETTIINGKAVTIYHHYEGLTDTDLLPIFKGKVDSPINWSEAERTLSFEIVSQIEGEEIGFAPDEDDLPGICEEAKNQPWPIIVGAPKVTPALKITCPAVGKLKNIAGRLTPQLLVDGGEQFPQGSQIDVILGDVLYSGQFNPSTYNNGQVFTISEFNKVRNLNTQIANRPAGDPDEFNPRVCWIQDPSLQMSGQYHMRDWGTLTPELTTNFCKRQEGTKLFFSRPWQEPGIGVPTPYTDYLLKNSDGVIDETAGKHRDAWNSIMIWKVGIGFEAAFGSNILMTWYFNPGSYVRQYGPETKYVVHHGSAVEVKEVYGEKEVNGVKSLVPLDPDWYTVNLSDTIAGKTVTTISFGNLPLEIRLGDWTGRVFTSADSGISENTVSGVLEYLIDTFTDLEKDAGSFAAVAAKIENYPSHFVLSKAGNAIQILEDIAFQARLGLRIEAGIVSIKYLSEDPGTSEDYSLTEADVELKSLGLTFTDKEDLYTKITATWQTDFSGADDKQMELVYKNNIDTFGLRERTLDFYIYSEESLVQKSLDFWGNRLSNMWRQVSITTFLTTLKLELFDVIEYALTDTTLIPPTGIKGVIDDIVQDPNSNRINIFCTLPSKAGTTIVSSDFYLDDSGDVKPAAPLDDIAPPASYPIINPQGNNTDLASSESQDSGSGDGGGGDDSLSELNVGVAAPTDVTDDTNTIALNKALVIQADGASAQQIALNLDTIHLKGPTEAVALSEALAVQENGAFAERIALNLDTLHLKGPVESVALSELVQVMTDSGTDVAALNIEDGYLTDTEDTLPLSDLVQIADDSGATPRVCLSLADLYVRDDATGLVAALDTLLTVRTDGGSQYVAIKTTARFSEGTNHKVFGFKYDSTDSKWRPDASFLEE